MNPDKDSNKDPFLQKLKRGDEQAVEELYEQAFHYCASFVLKNKGDIEDARGIFQESLIVLFRNIHKEGFELRSHIKTYLYGITRNIWLKKLDRQKRGGLSLVVDDPNSNFQVEETADDTSAEEKEEQVEKLEQALANHSEDCQRLLRLFYYENMSYKEVAQQMGYTDSYVRKKKMNCIQALRATMQ